MPAALPAAPFPALLCMESDSKKMNREAAARARMRIRAKIRAFSLQLSLNCHLLILALFACPADDAFVAASFITRENGNLVDDTAVSGVWHRVVAVQQACVAVPHNCRRRSGAVCLDAAPRTHLLTRRHIYKP